MLFNDIRKPGVYYEEGLDLATLHKGMHDSNIYLWVSSVLYIMVNAVVKPPFPLHLLILNFRHITPCFNQNLRY